MEHQDDAASTDSELESKDEQEETDRKSSTISKETPKIPTSGKTRGKIEKIWWEKIRSRSNDPKLIWVFEKTPSGYDCALKGCHEHFDRNDGCLNHFKNKHSEQAYANAAYIFGLRRKECGW